MRNAKLYGIVMMLILGISSLKAQDIHFSQFYASPMNMNPATTGVIGCDMRFSAIYRNQWASVMGNKAFNTFSAGFDMRRPVGRWDYYGVGLNLWADKAGTSSFSSMSVSLNGSFMKRLGGRRSNDMYLSAGGSLGFSQKSIKTLNLQFGSQWNGDAFDGSLSTGENFAGWDTRVTYGDISGGLYWWMGLDKKNKSNVYGGIAFHHLTKANQAFTSRGFDPLFMKTTINAGGEFRMSKKLAMSPNVVMMFQGPSAQVNMGASLRFLFNKRDDSQSFEIGPWYRIVSSPTGAIASDAAVIMTRLRYGGSAFGISYDINVSRLNPASRGNGGFELSYVFIFCGNGKNRPMACPTF